MPCGQEIGRASQALIPHQETQKRARAGEGSEQAQQHADAEGGSKTFHQTSSEEEQSCTADQGGEVAIDDRGKGRSKARFNGADQGVAAPELVFDPLENEHIRIDGHADAEDETGNARQGECDRNQGVDRQVEQRVEAECQHCHKSSQSVHHQHEQTHQHQTGKRRNQASTHILGTQRWADRAHFKNVHRQW